MKLSRTSLVAVAAVVVAAAPASCSAGPSSGSSTEPSRSKTVSATSSPSGTGPCIDGTCEIEVAVGDTVDVPQKYGLGPIEVTAIADTAVEMVAPLTESGYSVSGCSGGGGTSSQGGGSVGLDCEVGTEATINDAMILEVIEIRDSVATLSIEPAA